MRIVCPDFASGQEVPDPYTCIGANISPPLAFEDVPPTAVSLVLTVLDADATPVPWVHWLVFDIPAATLVVDAGTVPEGGVEGRANGGTPGYEGPCPKYFTGTHHYQFRLVALDTVLNLSPNADSNEVEAAMEDHAIEEAVLVGVKTGTLAE